MIKRTLAVWSVLVAGSSHAQTSAFSMGVADSDPGHVLALADASAVIQQNGSLTLQVRLNGKSLPLAAKVCASNPALQGGKLGKDGRFTLIASKFKSSASTVWISANTSCQSQQHALARLTLHAEGSLKLRYSLPKRAAASSSDSPAPVIAPDGSVYGTTDGTVYAYAQGGKPKWQVETGDGAKVGFAPQVGPDGQVYYASSTHVFAFDAATGQQRWKTDFADANNLFIRADGTLYLTARSGLYALDKTTGKTSWTFSTDKNDDIDSKIYFSAAGEVYILDTLADQIKIFSSVDGSVKASLPSGGSKLSIVNVGTDGAIYLVSDNTGSGSLSVYALDPLGGAVKWNHDFKTDIRDVALGKDGAAYIAQSTTEHACCADSAGGSTDGSVSLLDTGAGRLKWTYKTGYLNTHHLLLGSDDTLYLSADNSGQDSSILALNALSGKLKWKAAASPTSSLVCLGTDGTLYAFDPDTWSVQALYSLSRGPSTR